MILIVIEIGGVVVQELHLTEGERLVGQQFGGVETVVLSTHHLRQTGDEFVTAVDGDINLGGHALVALGLDEDDAVGTFGTIDGGTVLQHLDTLDVVDIQVGQHVVEVTIVESSAVVLHIHDDIIDDHQRLHIAVERVDARHQQGVAQAHVTAAGYRTDIGAKTLGDEGVDAHFSGVVETTGLRALDGIGLALVELGEGLVVEVTVGHTVGNGALLEVVAVDTHLHRADVVGHFQRIATFLIGHCRVLIVVVGGDDDTHQRFLGGSVDNLSCHSLTVLLCCHRHGYEQQNSGYDIFLHCSSDLEVLGLR